MGLALGWATDGTDKKRAISHAAPLNIPGLLLVVPVATPTGRIIHKNITEGYCFFNYRLVIYTHRNTKHEPEKPPSGALKQSKRVQGLPW